MNAVEIEEAVSALAAEPFDAEAFPWAFLQAFGNKETTITRLRSGQSNASDVPGGVLQRNNIHLAVAPAGEVAATLAALRDSAKTGSARAKFILATDGETLEAEDLLSGEPLACAYPDLAQAFAFFLPLAGISTVKEIKNAVADDGERGELGMHYTSGPNILKVLNPLFLDGLREQLEAAGDNRRKLMNLRRRLAGIRVHDLAGPTGRLALEENGLGEVEAETYVCGNPPYKGSQWQTDEQKADLRAVFAGLPASPGSLDHVSGWFMAARHYFAQARGSFAFVTANSINQGRQVKGFCRSP